jgi:hypothetical protein
MLAVLWIVGPLVALVLLLALVGACLPRDHVAACSTRVKASPGDVWTILVDAASWPTWAPGVVAMERLPDRDGKPVWKVVTRQGSMPSVVEVEDPPRRRVTRILDEGLAFGGSWTWDIAPDGDGSRVTLTEDGFVKNVVFRALVRFAFGPHATIEKMLAALAKRLGDDAARVERVR